jgi:hypothetical protein
LGLTREPGACSALVLDTVRGARARFEARDGGALERQAPEEGAAGEADQEPPSLARHPSFVNPPTVSVLCAVQDGVHEDEVPLPHALDPQDSLVMAFGRRPHPYPPAKVSPMATNVALPFCEWTAGHVLALAGQQSVLPFTWPAIAAARHAIVHVTPEGWMSGLRGASFSHHLNALFVIHPKPAPPAAQASREARDEWLNTLSTNFMAFAGRRSIVVVFVGEGRYLWYTGLRWPGLVDRVPAFGDEVDGIVERFPAWAAARAQRMQQDAPTAVGVQEVEVACACWYPASEALEWRGRFQALLAAVIESQRRLGEERAAPTSGLAEHEAKQERLAALTSQHEEALAKIGDLACEMRVLLPSAMNEARGAMLAMLRHDSSALIEELDKQREALGPISLTLIAQVREVE